MSEKRVVGVRFRHAGKVYYFDPAETNPKPGETVVVETVRGTEAAEVVVGCRLMPESGLSQPLRPVLRQATPEDIEHLAENRRKEQEAIRTCEAKVAEHKLDMQLVGADYTFDRGKLIFYFTSEGRVDFRQLVRDLSATFKTRIELRQIGVRDEAKMLGGIGSCGRELCCCTFLSEFQPVSIRMAKKQDLSLNPTKISGLCGRLMCCLRYESDHYPDATKPTAAQAGQAVVSDAGEADGGAGGGVGEAEAGGGVGEAEAGGGAGEAEAGGGAGEAEADGGAGEAEAGGGGGEAEAGGGAGEAEDKPEELAEVTGPVPVEEDRV